MKPRSTQNKQVLTVTVALDKVTHAEAHSGGGDTRYLRAWLRWLRINPNKFAYLEMTEDAFRTFDASRVVWDGDVPRLPTQETPT